MPYKNKRHHHHRREHSRRKSNSRYNNEDSNNSLRINVMKDIKSAQKLKTNLKNSFNYTPFSSSYRNNNNTTSKSTSCVMQAANLSTSFKGTAY
jgi:hypothetical protein